MSQLLHQTAKHDQELEKFKLQMLVDDNKHRKNMMILKVEGLSRIAKHFKYFKDAVK